MLGSFFSSIGGSIGKYFGGGILSSIGRYAGRYIGDFLERKWFHKKEVYQKYSTIKESFTLSMAVPGAPIPLIFGKNRVVGKIIWIDEIKNIAETSSNLQYFGQLNFLPFPKQIRSTTHYTEYKYLLSFVMCICEGTIMEVSRVWNGNEIIDISQYKFRLYMGTPDQMPDPYIQNKMSGQALGFRDLAYIFFEDLPLEDFDDMIPNLSFEVTRKPNISGVYTVEDMVKSMVMIPGSGEYVYDTIIQTKQILAQNGSIKAEKILNSHNFYNIPNSIYSLTQLKNVCENVEWITPVVCWFGNSLELSSCLIRPAVEFKDPLVRFSEEWRVGRYNRHNAHEITKDNYGNPRYGGSVNDQSVIRYLQQLRNRGLKIMFYPMFFLDVDLKPWRGRLTGNAKEVAIFFNKIHGYNEFIIHYANLVRDYVDAFIIGSELIGITKIKDPLNNFPAVGELVRLAEVVKNIVGQRVLVSYAADWSEYHHTEGGWYNLDPLWASPNIDFVGIDAYFPLTNLDGSFITNKDIKAGFCSGEGYDYYIDHNTNQKFPLVPEFAWKNIKYWWENTHRNPDGFNTPWIPKSKKIWFTEYGFPSIDKAPNQPNVFFDPLCIDGGIPRYSNGEIDFGIQRRCIRAFIEFWGKEEYIENMFLWTWDARPYPAWPHMDIWRDGYLWEKGHWVNDKFGVASVASIILEISNRCKIDLSNVEVKTVDEALTGVFFNNQISGKDAISILRSAYFFDISASNGQLISFIKRGVEDSSLIKSDDLIKISETSYINEVSIAKAQMLMKVDIYFQTQRDDYKSNYLHINNEEFSNLKNAVLRLPFVISKQEASQIGKLLLKNVSTEKMMFEFNLPISYFGLKAADFICLSYCGRKYHLRVIKTTFVGMIINVVAIIDEISNYHIPSFKNKINIFYQKNIEIEFRIIEIPFNFKGFDFPHLIVCLNSNKKLPLYIKIKENIVDDWNKIAILEPTNSIVKVIDFNGLEYPDLFCVDELSEIYVRGIELERFKDDSWKLIEIDGELIAFKTIRKLESEEEIYVISQIIRGVYGSEKHVKGHEINVTATIVAKNANILPIPEDFKGQVIEFRVGSTNSEICFTNQAKLPSKPIIVSNYIEDTKLCLSWITRSLKVDKWRNGSKRDIDFSVSVRAKGQELKVQVSFESNETEIDISTLDISDGYIVDII